MVLSNKTTGLHLDTAIVFIVKSNEPTLLVDENLVKIQQLDFYCSFSYIGLSNKDCWLQVNAHWFLEM